MRRKVRGKRDQRDLVRSTLVQTSTGTRSSTSSQFSWGTCNTRRLALAEPGQSYLLTSLLGCQVGHLFHNVLTVLVRLNKHCLMKTRSETFLSYLRPAQHIWHSFKHKKAVDSRNLGSTNKVKWADKTFSNLTTLLVRHPLWHIGWHLIGNLLHASIHRK